MTTPSQEHLLIVDDDADIRPLLRRYLQENGNRVTATADGQQMRAALAAGDRDFIILDMLLPGEDGISLCRAVRARSQVPIIMLTACGDDTDRIVGLEVGANDYVPKQFKPRDLLAWVKSVLWRAKSLPPNLRQEALRWFRFAG